MNHLTESQLNEYLDKTLSLTEQGLIEDHLSICVECRKDMEGLRNLFLALDGYKEEAINHDISQMVLEHLPRQKIPLGWKLVLAVQAGVAIGLTSLVVIDLLPLIHITNFPAILPFKSTQIHFPPLHLVLPALNFQTSTVNLVFLAVSVMVLWGVGNAVILYNQKEYRK